MSHKLAARRDRRHARRPRNGDTRPCARCGGVAEFTERCRFGGRSLPAWVCDRAKCAPVPARKTDAQPDPRELIRAWNRLQARARRAVMRTCARQERALEHMRRTEQLIERASKKQR